MQWKEAPVIAVVDNRQWAKKAARARKTVVVGT
jgi:hypothetical protein